MKAKNQYTFIPLVLGGLLLLLAATMQAQTLQTLASFARSYSIGQYPNGLTAGSNGDIFYGTSSSGGAHGVGMVFTVTTNGTMTRLLSFDGTNGANPEAALTLGSDGNFYGTTHQGHNNYGTVFRFTPPSLPR